MHAPPTWTLMPIPIGCRLTSRADGWLGQRGAPPPPPAPPPHRRRPGQCSALDAARRCRLHVARRGAARRYLMTVGGAGDLLQPASLGSVLSLTGRGGGSRATSIHARERSEEKGREQSERRSYRPGEGVSRSTALHAAMHTATCRCPSRHMAPVKAPWTVG